MSFRRHRHIWCFGNEDIIIEDLYDLFRITEQINTDVRALAIPQTSVWLLDDGFGYYSSGRRMSKLTYEQLVQSPKCRKYVHSGLYESRRSLNYVLTFMLEKILCPVVCNVRGTMKGPRITSER